MKIKSKTHIFNMNELEQLIKDNPNNMSLGREFRKRHQTKSITTDSKYTKMISDYPNDMQLGEKLRSLINY